MQKGEWLQVLPFNTNYSIQDYFAHNLIFLGIDINNNSIWLLFVYTQLNGQKMLYQTI